jgi:hypothetical protein
VLKLPCGAAVTMASVILHIIEGVITTHTKYNRKNDPSLWNTLTHRRDHMQKKKMATMRVGQ